MIQTPRGSSKYAGSPFQSGGVFWQQNLDAPLYTFTAENTGVLVNIENAKVEDFKGQLVKTVSEIEEIKEKILPETKRVITCFVRNSYSKGKVLPAQKINFEEVVTFAQSITLKPQAFKVDDEKHPDKIGKGLLELLLQKEHVLTPKAARLFAKLFSSDEQKFKITTTLSNQKETLDKHSKDIGLGKRSENIETFSHLIDFSRKQLLKVNEYQQAQKNKRKLEKPVLNNVDLSDTEFFKMNRALFEIFDLKDFVFTPVKSRIESDRALVKVPKQKTQQKPISNNIDLSDRETFDSIKSLFTDNGAFRVNTVNPTKARVESDKVY